MLEETYQTQDKKASAFYDTPTEVLRAFWGENFHCGFWIDENDEASLEQAQSHMTDLFIERLQAKPGSSLLDAGCGVGEPALRVAHATCASILGITIAQSQVQIAQEKARAQGLSDRVVFQCADMTSLPFEQASFDGVYAIESMVHVLDRISALREFYRVLKPGGRLVFSDIVANSTLSPQEEADGRSSLLSLVTPNLLMEGLRSTGFVSVNYLDLTSNSRDRSLKGFLERELRCQDNLTGKEREVATYTQYMSGMAKIAPKILLFTAEKLA